MKYWWDLAVQNTRKQEAYDKVFLALVMSSINYLKCSGASFWNAMDMPVFKKGENDIEIPANEDS